MTFSRRWLTTLAAAVSLIVLAVVGLQIAAQGKIGQSQLTGNGSAKTLVVFAHGMGGRDFSHPLVDLLQEQFPTADLMTFDYTFAPLTNLDPIRITSMIEQAIDVAQRERRYERIILVGHSAGAAFLRKALVWGAGYAEDRPAGRAQLPEEWVKKVDRFVSVAGINRGWSLSPKPKEMSRLKWIGLSLSIRAGRFLHTGSLIRAIERGSPFIADLRVQWMELARTPGGTPPPFTLHLLGDSDDIVSRDDSNDIGIAKDTCFLALQNTNHGNIASELGAGPTASPESRARHAMIVMALTQPRTSIRCDPINVTEDLSVTRIVFIMHGIRDHGEWTRVLAEAISNAKQPSGEKVLPVPAGYGYFPMMPFLLYGDRQRNVRWFMDQYTEQRALFPRAKVDFVGHSNGTYILASALERYRTLTVRNVYFAGSVVPQRYPWLTMISANRVSSVRNIVADTDRVVAWFPRLYEQIAEWLKISHRPSRFDIGAAGFRGFLEGADPLHRVENYEFMSGGHGSAVDMGKPETLKAVLQYVLTGEDTSLRYFRQTREPRGYVSVLSDISWFVWLFLLSMVAALGYIVVRCGGWMWLTGYIALILAIVNSV